MERWHYFVIALDCHQLRKAIRDGANQCFSGSILVMNVRKKLLVWIMSLSECRVLSRSVLLLSPPVTEELDMFVTKIRSRHKEGIV